MTEDGAERNLRYIAKMERDRRDHNREVRNRDSCRVCDEQIPDHDFSEKYAQAGGCLTGPFCSSECYWRWMDS